MEILFVLAARSVSKGELILQGVLLAGVALFIFDCMGDGIVKLSRLFRPSNTTYQENKTLHVHVSDDDAIHERSGYVAENVRQRMERLERGNS